MGQANLSLPPCILPHTHTAGGETEAGVLAEQVFRTRQPRPLQWGRNAKGARGTRGCLKDRQANHSSIQAGVSHWLEGTMAPGQS